MLKEYKMQSFLGIWGGILFFLIGFLITSLDKELYLVFGRLIMSASYLLFLSGCFMYSKGKGRGWFYGFFGLMGPVGLLLIYCLKDRSGIVLRRKKKEFS